MEASVGPDVGPDVPEPEMEDPRLQRPYRPSIHASPSGVVVNTQGRESGGSWFETCSGVWYPRRVAIKTLVYLIHWLGKPQVFCFVNHGRLHSTSNQG